MSMNLETRQQQCCIKKVKVAHTRLLSVGFRPDPAGRAYSAPPDHLADGEGAGYPLGEGADCPLPKNSTPALGLSGIACPRLLIFKPSLN